MAPPCLDESWSLRIGIFPLHWAARTDRCNPGQNLSIVAHPLRGLWFWSGTDPVAQAPVGWSYVGDRPRPGQNDRSLRTPFFVMGTDPDNYRMTEVSTRSKKSGTDPDGRLGKPKRTDLRSPQHWSIHLSGGVIGRWPLPCNSPYCHRTVGMRPMALSTAAESRPGFGEPSPRTAFRSVAPLFDWRRSLVPRWSGSGFRPRKRLHRSVVRSSLPTD